MNILIKYPSRQRPEQFKKTLTQWQKLLSGKHEVEFVCSFDLDDKTMNNIEIRSWLNENAKTYRLSYFYGNNKNKIQACNADLEGKSFDILILASDDMIPEVQNYDDIIAKEMKLTYPDTDGCLWYADGRQDNICTLNITGGKYYKRFNYCYHSAYKNVFCDNEYTLVASQLRKIRAINKVIIRHKWEDLLEDPLHKRNDIIWDEDKETYIARKAANFPIEWKTPTPFELPPPEPVSISLSGPKTILKPTLSILICSIPNRDILLQRLLTELERQKKGHNIEILVNKNENLSIGEKRNLLLGDATKDNLVFIDDDDMPSLFYLDSIMEALQSDPDVVGLEGTYINIQNNTTASFKHSIKYNSWGQDATGTRTRTPNHINPVRSALARKAAFPNSSFGEDQAYSEKLYPLLKTESYIKGSLYYYLFNPKKENKSREQLKVLSLAERIMYSIHN